MHDSDTYSTLENRTSWDEWDRDYDYEHPRTIAAPQESAHHRYAAYASAPSREAAVSRRVPSGADGVFLDGPIRVSMRVRRTRIFASLGLSAIVTTGLNFLIGLSLLQYLAVLSWIGLVCYVATALFAVSQGYLEVSSLIGGRRGAVVAPVYYDDDGSLEDDAAVLYADQEYYEDHALDEEPAGERWRREPRRVALG